MYGSGLRVMEGLRPRVKDLDLEQRQLTVRTGKGQVDRVTILAQSVIEPLSRHLRYVKVVHDNDLAQGYGRVEIPDALGVSYPAAEREWIWQYVFPGASRADGCRRHIHQSCLRKAIKHAVRMARISKRVTCHTLRRPFS